MVRSGSASVELRKTAKVLWSSFRKIEGLVLGAVGLLGFWLLDELSTLSAGWRWVMVVALASIAVLVVGFHRLRKTVDAARFMADYGSYLTGVHASLLRLLNSYSGEWRGDWEAERKEILIDFAVRVDGMEGSYPVTARRLLTWRQESGDRAVRVSGDQPYNEANREVARMELRIEMVLAEVRKQSTLDT